MARTPKPPTPSAIDGYRRLSRSARASHADAASSVVHDPGVSPGLGGRGRARRGRRVAGGLRLVAFAGVLALIVGTSVTLASADSSDEAVREPASPRQARTSAPDGATAAERRANARSSGSPVSDDAPSSADSAASSTSSPARATPTMQTTAVQTRAAAETALPFSGERETQVVLLAGGLLVLLGMLVQIAGQPLPQGASSSRTRRASRVT